MKNILSSDDVYSTDSQLRAHHCSAWLGRLARYQWMFLCRCSLFAEQELQQDKGFWCNRLPWAFGLTPHVPFFASEHGDLRSLWEGCCSPVRRLKTLQASLLWSSFRSVASDISKEEYFILCLPSLEIMSIIHLFPPKEKQLCQFLSALQVWKLLSTVHCFLLTYLGFFPREVSFLQGQGENLSHHDIQSTQLSFHSSLETCKEAVLLASQAFTSMKKVLMESYRQ